MPLDLFGVEIPQVHVPIKGGYAKQPGSGPVGETCGSCEHYTHAYVRSGRHFRKCGLMESSWTHGPGTDIKKKSPACSMWEISYTATLDKLRNDIEVALDLNKCPKCGGVADNGHDRCLPPSPYFCTKCTKLESKVQTDE